jgi:hypothetical protein
MKRPHQPDAGVFCYPMGMIFIRPGRDNRYWLTGGSPVMLRLNQPYNLAKVLLAPRKVLKRLRMRKNDV